MAVYKGISEIIQVLSNKHRFIIISYLHIHKTREGAVSKIMNNKNGNAIKKHESISYSIIKIISLATVAILLNQTPVLANDAGVPVSEGGEGRSVLDWPVGVTKYIPLKSFKGYTLWCSMAGDGTVNLMDMKGNIVHTWKNETAPGLYGELLDNGNLLYSGRTRVGYGSPRNHPMSGKGGVLWEKDWNNNVVAKIINDAAHHDQAKLPNGNYLQIAWDPVPKGMEERIPGGIYHTEHKDGMIFEELITETTPRGERIWEWRPSDHLNPEEYPICPLNDRKEWLHANSVEYLPKGNPITDTESVMVSLRHNSICIIFEKATGEVQWRYGGCMDGEWGKLGAQHDFSMIKEGLPGYGNVMIFDNGMNLASVRESGLYWGIAHSRVLEIDPKTKKVVWTYDYQDKNWNFPIKTKWLFNSPYIAGAQRLPNGNTLICEGGTGRIFEVTKENEIVWEFVNPDRKAIYRAYRYGPDFIGFNGKNLPGTN